MIHVLDYSLLIWPIPKQCQCRDRFVLSIDMFHLYINCNTKTMNFEDNFFKARNSTYPCVRVASVIYCMELWRHCWSYISEEIYPFDKWLNWCTVEKERFVTVIVFRFVDVLWYQQYAVCYYHWFGDSYYHSIIVLFLRGYNMIYQSSYEQKFLQPKLSSHRRIINTSRNLRELFTFNSIVN